MNLIRSSNSTVVLALLAALLVGTAGTAMALSISAENVPDEAEVGSEVNATITVDDAYTDNAEWTLETETELTNVSWTVEEFDQGSRVNQWNGGGQTFSQNLSSDPSGDEVQITIRGTVPSINNYTYEPKENFTFVAIKRTTGDNTETLKTYSVHHFTNDSKTARKKIDAAQSAINNTGGDSEAEADLEQAISAYDSANFDNAISIAEDAKSKAQQKQQSQQTTQLLLFGGIGVVVIVLVGGGVWYYRKQQDNYDKLR